MHINVINLVVSVLLIFVQIAAVPMYYMGIIQWARDDLKAQMIACKVVDQVIDTRELTDDMLADFNLEIAELNGHYKGTITREMEVINPLPDNPGETYSSYIPVEDNTMYNQGDLVVAKIENIGYNMMMAVSTKLVGINVYSEDIVFPGRVR